MEMVAEAQTAHDAEVRQMPPTAASCGAATWRWLRHNIINRTIQRTSPHAVHLALRHGFLIKMHRCAVYMVAVVVFRGG